MSSHSLYYILNAAGEPVGADVLTWSSWMQRDPNRTVARSHIGPVEVSTVFLGMDFNHGYGRSPIIWETMVFGGEMSGRSMRYETRMQAIAGHEAMCARVRESLAPEEAE